MKRKSVLKRIFEENKDRKEPFVQLKYQALMESPFRFFRGTCHLFYEDMPHDSFILATPRVWLCGDLHLENFGSFKGLHRLYFDMNDFDEAFLGPCLLDVVRLCTSIYLISYSAKISNADCRKLISTFLLSYATTLQEGEAYFLEHNTATGFLRKFLDGVNKYKRKDLLLKKMRNNGKVRLQCDNIKSFKAGKEVKQKVKQALAKWVETNFADPRFFQVKDIVHWAGGTGSIGVEKYLVLVNGNETEGLYLLSIKEATAPSALKYLKLKQPAWANDARRITAVQRRVQAALPIFFSELDMEGKQFVIKEKQPEESKVAITTLMKNKDKFLQLMGDMGAVVAWNSIRSGGRQGSAIADELIAFGKRVPKLEDEIAAYAQNYAALTVKNWKEFNRSYALHTKMVLKKQHKIR